MLRLSTVSHASRVGTWHRPRPRLASVGAICTALLVACGGGSEPAQREASELELTASTPMPSASGVSRSSAIELRFSAPLASVVPADAGLTLCHSRGCSAVDVELGERDIEAPPRIRLETEPAAPSEVVSIHGWSGDREGQGASLFDPVNLLGRRAWLLPLTRYTLSVPPGMLGAAGERSKAPRELSFTTADGVWSRAGMASGGELIIGGGGSSCAVHGGVLSAMNPSGQRVEVAVRSVWDDSATPPRHSVRMTDCQTGLPFAEFVGDAPIQLKIDSQGGGLLLWFEPGADGQRLRASSRPPAGAWTAPVDLSDPGRAAESSHLGVDDQGRAVAVWREATPSLPGRVWSSHHVPGQGWSHAVALDAGSGEDVSLPRVTVNLDGEFIATWQQATEGTTQFWSNRAMPNGSWAGPVRIGTTPGESVEEKAAGVDGRGRQTVVWIESNAGLWAVKARQRDAGGNWEPNVVLASNSRVMPQGLKLVLNAAGEAVAAWASEHEAKAVTYRPTQGWAAVQSFVESSHEYVQNVSPVIDASGNAMLMWASVRPGVVARVRHGRFVAAEGWGAAGTIVGSEALQVYALQAQIDAAGSIKLRWASSHSSGGASGTITIGGPNAPTLPLPLDPLNGEFAAEARFE